MKLIKYYPIFIVFLSILITSTVIFSDYIFDWRDTEKVYFQFSVFGVIISAFFLLANLYVIIKLSIGSESIYNRAIDLFERLESNSKSVEFNALYHQITLILDEAIDDSIRIYRSADIKLNTASDLQKAFNNSKRDELILHLTIATRYTNVYQNFKTSFSQYHQYQLVIESSRRYEEMNQAYLNLIDRANDLISSTS